MLAPLSAPADIRVSNLQRTGRMIPFKPEVTQPQTGQGTAQRPAVPASQRRAHCTARQSQQGRQNMSAENQAKQRSPAAMPDAPSPAGRLPPAEP